MTFSASQAWLAWNCAESIIRDGAVNVDPVNDAAEIGSAFHAWARTLGTDEEADAGEIADRFGIDRDELDGLIIGGRQAWQSLGTVFGDGESELAIAGCLPDGTPVSATIDRVCGWSMLDWKTGRLDTDYSQQMRCAAYLLAQREPAAQAIRTVVVYVRLGIIDAKTYTRTQLDEWAADMVHRLAKGRGTYSPGPHCDGCPRRVSCPGRLEWTRTALAAFAADETVELTHENKAMLGPSLLETREKVRHIEARCKEWLDALKSECLRVGPIPDGNGKELRVLQKHRRKVLLRKGWERIADSLGDDVFELMSLPVTKLPRDVQRELDDMGAIDRVPYDEVRLMKENGDE